MALKHIQDEKDTLLPIEFCEKYWKAFFEIDGPNCRLTKQALAIVGWRLLQTIEWTKKPKWLTQDKLYVVACVHLPGSKKAFILRALSTDDAANMKIMDAP